MGVVLSETRTQNGMRKVARGPKAASDPAVDPVVDLERMASLAAFTARSLRAASPRPFGASIVHTKSGEVLLRALNMVKQEIDPSSHAEVTFTGAYEGPRTQPLLSDYTWNHTTLWAMKADPAYTYLQCGFSATKCREQFQLLRERYGQEILFHIEFMKNGEGVVVPGAIPVVRFTTDD